MRKPRILMRRSAGAMAATFLVPFAIGGSVAVPVAAGGHMFPAIGAHPNFVRAGHAGTITFGCQQPAAAVHCYGPQQIRTAYSIQPLLNQGSDGSGRTIVIIDAFQSPTIRHDLTLFDRVFGIPAPPSLQIIAPFGLTPFNQSDPNQTGWAGEISLDVEWSHAVAPGANIVLALAPSNADLDLLNVQRYVVDHNVGDVISQSFGEAEQCMEPSIQKAQHQVFDAAKAKRITVFASSGDSGAALPTCDGSSVFKAASTPASDPNVTGVGGTSLTADLTDGRYISETVWNEFATFVAAGGGGFSVLYKTPAYQKGVGAIGAMRGVPDVAYNAGIDGGVLTVWSTSGQGQNLVFIFGGTSSGSPQWSGITAIADQLAGHRLGFLNNAIYKIGKTRMPGVDFNDITVGDNTFPPITGFAAVPGWDAASGWGTPIASNLAFGLNHP